MTFRSKPRLIEAEQFFRDKPLPFQRKGPYVQYGCHCRGPAGCSRCGTFWVVTAHNQTVTLADGDWVIPEPSGPHIGAYAAYPVKPDIFAATYEPAESIDARLTDSAKGEAIGSADPRLRLPHLESVLTELRGALAETVEILVAQARFAHNEDHVIDTDEEPENCPRCLAWEKRVAGWSTLLAVSPIAQGGMKEKDDEGTKG